MSTDPNEMAKAIADAATKDAAAVELGRRGGRKGGPARAASMTPERRSEIAAAAAAARWGKRPARERPPLDWDNLPASAAALEVEFRSALRMPVRGRASREQDQIIRALLSAADAYAEGESDRYLDFLYAEGLIRDTEDTGERR